MEGGLPSRLSAQADRPNRAKTCPRRGTCGGTPSDLNLFGVFGGKPGGASPPHPAHARYIIHLEGEGGKPGGASPPHPGKPTVSFVDRKAGRRRPSSDSLPLFFPLTGEMKRGLAAGLPGCDLGRTVHNSCAPILNRLQRSKLHEAQGNGMLNCKLAPHVFPLFLTFNSKEHHHGENRSNRRHW